MSANLDLMRSIYAAWERGDFSHGEWADPEIEWVLVEGPSPGTWHGKAGMAEGFRTWFSSSEDVHVYADELRELDDERVAVLVHSHRAGQGDRLGVHARADADRTPIPRPRRQGRQVPLLPGPRARPR